jgi:hypothetical protein
MATPAPLLPGRLDVNITAAISCAIYDYCFISASSAPVFNFIVLVTCE